MWRRGRWELRNAQNATCAGRGVPRGRQGACSQVGGRLLPLPGLECFTVGVFERAQRLPAQLPGVTGDRGVRQEWCWLRSRVHGLSGSCHVHDTPATAPLRALRPYRHVPGPGAPGASRSLSPAPGEARWPLVGKPRSACYLFLICFPKNLPPF